MPNTKLPIKHFLLLMLVAYIFSIAVRTIWVFQSNDIEVFRWNDQLMINTNDGYGYAEGARDRLVGFHQDHDKSFYNASLSIITEILAKILPFSFETIILWMPAFMGSLLVIPILLMARALNQEYAGFIGAMLGGIAWSYYNRTMTGYYDTDMLSIVLPTFTLWAVILSMLKEKNRYLILVAFFMMASNWWYAQSYSLNLAMAGMVLIYTLIFDRKNIFNYKVLIFMIIALVQIDLYVKMVLIIAVFALFHMKKDLDTKVIFTILALSILMIFVTGGLDPIISRLNGYIFRTNSDVIIDGVQLHYFSVVKTVREAGQIPFDMFANRISGHTITLILSVIGYLLLLFRHRIFLLSLPLAGLGFLALWGGLRFTVYAVPVLALGIGYLIIYASEFIKDKKIKLAFIAVSTIAIIIPNILHIEKYKVPTVFKKDEVKVLDKLKNIASREDYVIAWWDYGYPIRYYSDVKTLTDGAQHSGLANYPVSFSLLRNQQASANMARMSIEYMEHYYDDINFTGTVLEQGMKQYKMDNINDFISSLDSEVALPKKTRDIYFYLPFQMMGILPTIDLFSNLNPSTGQQYKRPLFARAKPVGNRGNSIMLNNGMEIRDGAIHSGGRVTPINQMVVTEYDAKGVLRKSVQHLDIGSPIYVIFMRNYNQFLILDKRLFNSTYIQLFVLENYDPKLFEPVILTPLAKVFKLKI